VVECGVFRGGTALLEALTISETTDNQTNRYLHLFDSFAGMPEESSPEESFSAADFSRTSPEHVRRLLSDFQFVRLHVGFIPNTFKNLTMEQIAWAHIDLDMYESVHDAITFLYPRIVPGGIMIFDDYGFPSCPGARKAVDEAFAKRPEIPLCLPTGQCLVIKL
jgi:O-methyltransferase